MNNRAKQKKFKITAKRHGEATWSEWATAPTIERAEEHFYNILSLGYCAQISTAEKNAKIIKTGC